MAIGSLTRFTVPVGSGGDSSFQGLLMPKLKYRFRVTLDGFGVAGTPSTELTKQVMTVNRPSVSFEEIKLGVYNSTIKMAGKHSWEPTALKLRDDVTGTVSKKVGEQLQKQFDFYEQSGAASAQDYKFTMNVEILDGGNGTFEAVVLEKFTFLGCYINKATYQGGDYSSATDIMDIDLAITYDNAIQYGAGGQIAGIGMAISRTLGTGATG
jgi:hypothetical protein